MKNKKYLLLLPLFLLSGCNQNNPSPSSIKVHLTYSTLVNDSYINLSYEEFKDKMNVEGSQHIESFVIFTWNDCGCGETYTFMNHIENYIKATNTVIYAINGTDERLYDYYSKTPKEFTEERNLGLKFRASYPSISFVEDGTVKYTELFDSSLFTNFNKLSTFLDEHIIRSNVYLVNNEYMIANDIKDEIVYFMRGNCGDCQFAGPHIVYPYMKEKVTSKRMLVFDIDFIWAKDPGEGGSEEEKKAYKDYCDFKDYWKLSEKGDSTLGYSTGVVPTFHYYDSKGELKDACVYSNDSVSKQGEKVVISQSYWTINRTNPFIKSLKDVNTNLIGVDVTNDVIEFAPGFYYLSTEKAAKYHDPILKGFLDYYL